MKNGVDQGQTTAGGALRDRMSMIAFFRRGEEYAKVGAGSYCLKGQTSKLQIVGAVPG